ncbi:MAG: hypothetical protein WC474_12500, partial [Hydrogenophilaceae bacterium]
MAIRPLFRYALWGLAAPALLVLVLALAWLAGSEPALRLLASQAEGLSGNRLVIRGVHGSVYGPLHVDAITLTTETKRIELSDARLDWSPRALWQGRLEITRLDLAAVRVVTVQPDPEPPQLPDSLRLPVDLNLPAASLARLVIQTGAGEQVLSDIRLGLVQAGHTYRLDLRNLSTPWGRVEARARLADAPPYAIAGQAHLRHPSGSATANLGGRLDRIDLKAAAALAGGEARADLLLTPFARRPLAEARVSASGIDPAAWDPDLPRAELDLTASLHSQGAQDYVGELSVGNRLPGTWDKQRLPLRELSVRVSGSADAMALSELNLDLARAGRFAGSGRADPERLALDLQTRDFDPRGLHGSLRSLRLAGSVRLQAEAGRQGLQADLGYRGYRLDLDTEQHDRVLHIKQARLVSGAGQLSLFGSLGLDPARPFDLVGALDGFDPAAFGAYPKGRINASFHAAGRLVPTPEATLSFAIADSRFRNQPLAGQGNLRLSARRLWDSDAELRLAGNRLKLHGAFGAPGDRLAFELLASQLGVVDPALAGRIEATGQLSGSLADPTGEVAVLAEGLAWGQDYRLGSLHAKARLDQGLDGSLALDARLANLKTPALTLDRASLSGQGRRDRHRLAVTAGNPDLDLDLDAEVAGAWRAAGWTGQILRLTSQGRYPLALQAPARLELGADGGRLSGARLTALGASFDILDARYQAGRISSQGAFKGLSVKALQGWPAWPAWPENI